MVARPGIEPATRALEIKSQMPAGVDPVEKAEHDRVDTERRQAQDRAHSAPEHARILHEDKDGNPTILAANALPPLGPVA